MCAAILRFGRANIVTVLARCLVVTELTKNTSEPPKSYKFEGRVVRLSAAHYDQWRRSYSHIRDFDGALQLADDYYADNPPIGGWFIRVSRWLAKENEKAKAAAKIENYGGDWW